MAHLLSEEETGLLIMKEDSEFRREWRIFWNKFWKTWKIKVEETTSRAQLMLVNINTEVPITWLCHYSQQCLYLRISIGNSGEIESTWSKTAVEENN